MSQSQISNRVFHSTSLGKNIRVREWHPVGPEKGQVLVLHGLGDHSARHDWAASLFTDAGFRAVGFDWPGNGESEGIRGDMPSVSESGRLLQEVTAAFDLHLTGIYAHSTGAFMLLHWLGGHPPLLSSLKWVWMSSPLLVPSHGQPAIKIALARFLAPYFPLTTLSTGVKPRDCYHTGFDPLADSALKKAGGHHRVSLRFATNLLETETALFAAAESIRSDIQFLVTQGSEDKVCPPPYAERLLENLPGEKKCLLLVSGSRHEPFREPDHTGITNAVRSWLNSARDSAL